MRGEPGAHLGKQALGHARHAAGVVVDKQSRVHTLISRDVRYTASVNELNTHTLSHTQTETVMYNRISQQLRLCNTAKYKGTQSVTNTYNTKIVIIIADTLLY